MKQGRDHFMFLFQQFINKQASPEEVDRLFELLKETEYEQPGLELLDIYFSQPQMGKEFDKAYWLSKLEEIKRAAILNEPVHVQTRRNLRSLNVSRWWWAAAAVVLLLAGGIRFVTGRRTVVKPAIAAIHSTNDVPSPKSVQAVLTLANGKKITLDSVANGSLALQGNTRITKLNDGQIIYTGNGKMKEEEYNTLEVPKGSRIATITLNDGTRVWLNSGSSIKYPVAFTGADRKVEITGEAYFEVAKVSGKRFFVSGGGITTEVLGTHFNVNVYNDEADRRVTLLEGSIRVNKGSQQNILKPGEQLQITNTGGVNLLEKVDLDAVIAWKNALFKMEKADIGQIMRQISRWYNVGIVYKDGIPQGRISGEIPRDMQLSEVLKVMKLSGVHFSMEEGKVIVSR